MIAKNSLIDIRPRNVHQVRPEIRGLKGVRVQRKGRETLESWIKPTIRDKFKTKGICKFVRHQIRLYFSSRRLK